LFFYAVNAGRESFRGHFHSTDGAAALYRISRRKWQILTENEVFLDYTKNGSDSVSICKVPSYGNAFNLASRLPIHRDDLKASPRDLYTASQGLLTLRVCAVITPLAARKETK